MLLPKSGPCLTQGLFLQIIKILICLTLNSIPQTIINYGLNHFPSTSLFETRRLVDSSLITTVAVDANGPSLDPLVLVSAPSITFTGQKNCSVNCLLVPDGFIRRIKRRHFIVSTFCSFQEISEMWNRRKQNVLLLDLFLIIYTWDPVQRWPLRELKKFGSVVKKRSISANKWWVFPEYCFSDWEGSFQSIPLAAFSNTSPSAWGRYSLNQDKAVLSQQERM